MTSREAKILVPLPRYGFDPAETCVPWNYLKSAGLYQVVFSTPDGTQARTDERTLTGKDLGLLAGTLACDQDTANLYHQMAASEEFQKPVPWNETRSEDYDAILLPGGHDKPVREYLESIIIQKIIGEMFDQDKPVATICHGVLLASRSVHPKTGKSVLYGRKTTGFTRWQEMACHNLTRLWLGDYYLTYPQIYMEDDVKQHLARPEDFEEGPGFPIPLNKDTDAKPDGFALLDGKYLSARWPGDVHRFATDFINLLASANSSKQ